MNDSYIARWSRDDDERLVITSPEGKRVDSFAVPPGSDRPSPAVFFGSVWAPFPGSEWEEEPPGRWSVAVFRERAGKAGRLPRGMSRLRDQRRRSVPGEREPESGWLWWAAVSSGGRLAS